MSTVIDLTGIRNHSEHVYGQHVAMMVWRYILVVFCFLSLFLIGNRRYTLYLYTLFLCRVDCRSYIFDLWKHQDYRCIGVDDGGLAITIMLCKWAECLFCMSWLGVSNFWIPLELGKSNFTKSNVGPILSQLNSIKLKLYTFWQEPKISRTGEQIKSYSENNKPYVNLV